MLANGHIPVPLETARALLRDDIYCVPVKRGAKTVTRDGWILERWGWDDLERKFGGETNIGVLVGPVSGNLADCDLDTAEAVMAGAYFLPQTDMVWGHASKRHSHLGYRIDSAAVKSIDFKDPLIKRTDADSERRAMLCQLRLKGQTLVPGSLHPSGEMIEWDVPGGDHTPAPIAYDALKAAMGKVAACALLARYWTEGIRHEATLPLAGMLCRGGMDENQAQEFIRALCLCAGDTDLDNRLAAVTDTYKRAESGQTFTGGGALESFFEPTVIAKVRVWLNLSASAYTGDIGPDGWPLSDIGNAERFAAKWKGAVLYCPVESAWYIWTGKQWAVDQRNQIYQRAVTVVNDFRALAYSSATISRGNTTPDQWKRHADKFGQLKQIRAMLELSGSLMPVVPAEFDEDQMLLNVQNGTLELNVRSGEVYLREHRPDDLLTMICPVAYRPDARHPLFDDYLDRFFPEADRRTFLQEHAGYLLTGIPKRYSLELVGLTNSGKSMTLDLFAKVLGGYAGTLKYDSLMRNTHRGGDVPRADLWNVRNKRLVTIAEIPPDTHYDVALFKTLLSGGDKQLVRTLFDRTGGQSIAFSFALWTSGNQPYGPPSGEEAAYERLHVLRCNHQVIAKDRNDLKQAETLDPDITGEAVLYWMTVGFTALYSEKKGRLTPTEEVQRHTKELQDNLDPYARILDEHEWLEVTRDENDGVVASEAWEYARAFRERESGRLRNTSYERAMFTVLLERRGAVLHQTKTRFRNRDYWRGVRWSDAFKKDHLVDLPDWQTS